MVFAEAKIAHVSAQISQFSPTAWAATGRGALTMALNKRRPLGAGPRPWVSKLAPTPTLLPRATNQTNLQSNNIYNYDN